MLLIIGLGNPGKKYQFIRHNVGYVFVDWLVNECAGSRLRLDDSRGFARTVAGPEFVKTSRVFMNESGKFVAKELKKRGLKLDQLLLVHDDLDLELGQFKLQKGRGDAGHKGVKSVIQALGTKDFWRLRLGVGRPPVGRDPESYVLERFSKEELKVLEKLFPLITLKDVLS